MPSLDREFVGYGKAIPKVEWPKGAKLALTFAINYEAGAERSLAFGDHGPETYGKFPDGDIDFLGVGQMVNMGKARADHATNRYCSFRLSLANPSET